LLEKQLPTYAQLQLTQEQSEYNRLSFGNWSSTQAQSLSSQGFTPSLESMTTTQTRLTFKHLIRNFNKNQNNE
jgi:hypothetical protein